MPAAVDPALELRRAIADRLARFRHDPLGFVRFAWRWGVVDTELSGEPGPREWQVAVLTEIGERLRAGASPQEAIRVAVASGHGIGKSALVAWLLLWALSTKVDTKCVVTANTEPQLRTKTWPEVAKWHRLMLHRDWFVLTATCIYSADPAHEKEWRADAITWSENNTEAFAGLHNKGKRILLIFDESSSIADRVWEVAEGALTDEDTEIIWCAFGNPTQNTGRFRECFGRLAHRWNHRQIDSRTVPGTNKAQIAQWVADYGEDGDFVRVRVRGVFPRSGSTQFISSEAVRRAATRDLNECVATQADPLVLGVDVSRFGDDETTLYFRRGRDARSIPPVHFRGMDTMQTAGRVVEAVTTHGVDAVFVDETGVGGGVIDRCRQLGLTVMGVNNGGRADNPPEGELVANKGAECWARGRQWLAGGAIPDDQELAAQLEGRQYGFNSDNEIMLEKKADMKKRGLSSPDRADGLMLTFACPVAQRAVAYDAELRAMVRHHQGGGRSEEYDPFRSLR